MGALIGAGAFKGANTVVAKRLKSLSAKYLRKTTIVATDQTAAHSEKSTL